VQETPPVQEAPPAPEPEEPSLSDDRGTPPEAIDPTEDTNFLEDFFDMILSLFGLGKDDDEPAPVPQVQSDAVTLADVVPTTCHLDATHPRSTSNAGRLCRPCAWPDGPRHTS